MGEPEAKKPGSDRLRTHLSRNSATYAATAIGVVLSVLLGTIAVPGQEWFKRKFWNSETTVELRLISSSVAAFPSASSFEILQLLAYEISANDLVSNIKIESVFDKQTEIDKSYVIYSIDLFGYDANYPAPNHLIIRLSHDLNVSRRVTLYMLTKRLTDDVGPPELELPDIHVMGKDSERKTVYE